MKTITVDSVGAVEHIEIPYPEEGGLELMGHRRLGGYVKPVELCGAGFLRIDVPETDGEPAATQFYSPSSIYALTPTTEQMARAVAASNKPQPVARWELRQLPAPLQAATPNMTPASVLDEDDDEPGDYDHDEKF